MILKNMAEYKKKIPMHGKLFKALAKTPHISTVELCLLVFDITLLVMVYTKKINIEGLICGRKATGSE